MNQLHLSSRSLCIGVVSLLFGAAPAAAQFDNNDVTNDSSSPLRLPLALGFQAPQTGAIQYRSGWRLSIAMTPREAQGFSIYVGDGAEPYPKIGRTSSLLLRDLDGCPRIADPRCPDVPGDELSFSFTPDQDLPFVADSAGEVDVRDQLASDAGRPLFTYNGESVLIGPGIQTSSTASPDGIGYGPNDDLPGLVLLSNVGVGQVLTSDLGVPGNVTGFDPLPVPRARNLAGLMTEVGFDLRRKSNRTVVSTSMIVPPGLFSPTILVDECAALPNEPFCVVDINNPGLQRVDGGMLEPYIFQAIDAFDFATATYPNVVDIEIRAVMVQGTAPTYVDDCSGDGQVTARDLVCSGYRVLSNEATTTVRVGGFGYICNDGVAGSGPFGPARGLRVDFDGFPIVAGSIPCPTGSGRTTSPPD